MNSRGWTRRRGAVGALAAVATFAVAGVALAAANPSTTHVRTQQSGVIVSPCGPAGPINVAFTSRITAVYHGVTDGSGGIHLTGHIREHLTGSDALGGSYIGTSSGNVVTKVPAGSASVAVSIEHFRLIRKGESWKNDDKFVHTTFHLTVNANGQVTAMHATHRLFCN